MNSNHLLAFTNLKLLESQKPGVKLTIIIQLDIPGGYFSLPGHHMLLSKKDRLQGKGGDVLLFVHESLDVAPCDDLSNSNFDDSVLCKIRLLENDPLLIGVIII